MELLATRALRLNEARITEKFHLLLWVVWVYIVLISIQTRSQTNKRTHLRTFGKTPNYLSALIGGETKARKDKTIL